MHFGDLYQKALLTLLSSQEIYHKSDEHQQPVKTRKRNNNQK